MPGFLAEQKETVTHAGITFLATQLASIEGPKGKREESEGSLRGPDQRQCEDHPAGPGGGSAAPSEARRGYGQTPVSTLKTRQGRAPRDDSDGGSYTLQPLAVLDRTR